MKRIFLLVGALFLLASCTTELDQLLNVSRSDKARQTTVFQASTEVATAPETKVYADEDMKVLWNADDRISIFNFTTYNYQYAFTGDDGDTAGDFENVTPSGFHTGQDVDYVYAAYPYSKNNKLSNIGVFTMILPAEQSYKEHSFGVGANAMMAVTDGTFLAFKNAGGYLSLRLYGDNISVSRITIKGNNGEKIAGKASISMPLGGTPTVTMDATATDEISIVCDPAVKIGADANSYTDFWFVIPPITFKNGFTITVTDDQGGTFAKTTTQSFTVSRNTLDWMNPLKVEVKNENLIEYNVGDIVDSDGLGVVCWVSDDREQALLISVTEITKKDWTTSNDWCNSYGESWRMPAIEELTLIHSNFSTINAFLSNAGYTTLSTGNICYWSSTVNPNYSNYYYRERLSDGAIYNYGNDENISSTANYARAVKTIYANKEEPSAINVTGVAVSDTTLTIKVGESTQLTALVSPTDATSKEVIWYTSDANVADVNNNGIVTALSPGIAEITVETVDGGFVATCEVLVESSSISISVQTMGAVTGQTVVSFSSNSYHAVVNGLLTVDGCEYTATRYFLYSKSYSTLEDLKVGGTMVTADETFSKKITGLAEDTKYYYVAAAEVVVGAKKEKYYGIVKSFNTPSYSIPDYVDLDLPSGIKWGTKNLGATVPVDKGTKHPWYKSSVSIKARDPQFESGDNLLLSEDVAHDQLGGNWRTPTYAEWRELLSECDVSYNSGSGLTIKSKTHPTQKIFIPSTTAYWTATCAWPGYQPQGTLSWMYPTAWVIDSYHTDPNGSSDYVSFSTGAVGGSSGYMTRSIRPVYVDR